MSELTRISVAALVHNLRHNWFATNYFGIWLEKRKRWGALGGAVELTTLGKTLLENFHAATAFEGTGMDARFKVPNDQVEDVLELFRAMVKSRNEIDPRREVGEELFTPELAGQAIPILPPEFIDQIRLEYKLTYIQPPKDNQVRLFYIYDLRVPRGAYKLMKKSSHLRFLSKQEVETTQGGTKIGKTHDGMEIADNLFLT